MLMLLLLHLMVVVWDTTTHYGGRTDGRGIDGVGH